MTYELWHLGGQSGYRDTTKFGHFLTHNAVCSELSKWLILEVVYFPILHVTVMGYLIIGGYIHLSYQ